MAMMAADVPEAVATSAVGKGSGSSVGVKLIVSEAAIFPKVSLA